MLLLYIPPPLMKELPPHARPREKMYELGPEALSMKELCALVFGMGTRQCSVEKMSEEASALIEAHGMHIHMEELQGLKCLVPSQRMRLLAVLEMGKRIFSPTDFSISVIRTSEDALIFLKEYASLEQEHMICLYLNARNEMIKRKVVTIGTLTMNLVHPREVFVEALRCAAVSIIIAHNHPSGSLEPSHADYEVTERLQASGKILGVTILDHILVSKNGWRSILRKI